MSSTSPADAAPNKSEPAIDRELLLSVLSELAEHEEVFTDRFYALFFDHRPDTLPLFGVHAIAEREEMMRETLKSVHAWVEGESWLSENLRALGRSHWEYGVTADMYTSFVDVMIECYRETLASRTTDSAVAAFRAGLEYVSDSMRVAGDEASRASATDRVTTAETARTDTFTQ